MATLYRLASSACVALACVGMTWGCDADDGAVPIGNQPTASTTPRGDATSPGDTQSGTLSADAIIASPADLTLYERFTVIDGDLVITSTDASGVRLASLRRVTGAIVVEGTAAREVSGNLDLPVLEHLGGDLRMRYNQAAATVALPRLEHIGGHVELAHGIYDLRTLRLAHLHGDLRVHDASIAGLQLADLETIGGSIALTRYSVEGAPAILQLELHRLREIGGGVSVSHGVRARLFAPSLERIGGDVDANAVELSLETNALAEIGGHLRLGRVALYSWHMDQLAELGGELVVKDAGGPALVTFAAPALAAIGGGVEIARVAGLENVNLNALVDLGGALRLTGNDDLRTVSFRGLADAPADVVLGDNGAFTASFTELTTVGGALLLGDNDRLDASFPALRDVVGPFALYRQRIGGFTAESLRAVGGTVALNDLTFESSGPSFPLLASAGQDLVVRDNAFLRALELPLLEAVGTIDAEAGEAIGDLMIARNPELETLTLTKLEQVALDLTIRDNASLPAAVIDAALDGISLGGVERVCGNLGDAPCE